MRNVIVGLCLLFAAGCGIYDKPVFVEIGNSQTAFMIKVEGDGKQGSTNSEEFLKSNRIQEQRVQIPYRWVKLGNASRDGKYIPEARLIVVDRKPITREWTADAHNGTSTKNEALWVESSDSVNFSAGISIVARITNKDDAVKFLYNYPANRDAVIKLNDSYKDDYIVKMVGLEDVMDTEIRAVLQRVFAREAAKYTMDEGRTKKNEMMEAMRKEADEYFKERGITITSIGMFGGLTYQNPAIQQEIDKVFRAQQDKSVAKAEFEAAQERKKALQAAGEGEAGKVLAIKEGEAKGIKAVADAKAYELQKLQENPAAYLSLKQMEVFCKALETWDGHLPVYMLGNGQAPAMIFSAPDMDKLQSAKKKVDHKPEPPKQ